MKTSVGLSRSGAEPHQLTTGRRSWLRLAGICLACCLSVRAAEDLRALATIDGASGYEGAVLDYVRKAVGGRQEVDNTGSLTATFGAGRPHTLFIAGLDEPGYVASAITSDGYLRVHRLSPTPPHPDFDRFFLAQPVRVTTASGRAINGVVAGLSVHLQTERAAVPKTEHPEQMYVDIGAHSEREAREAGVDLLDPITLEKSYTELGAGKRMSAPWISARAGAAVLIALAERMRRAPPSNAVTLAFVSQQYGGNQGLARVLERVAADRVVWIKPGGNPHPAIAPVSYRTSQMADLLAALAEKRKLEFDRAAVEKVLVPAFANEEIWKNPSQVAAVTLGVENAGTPVETVARASLDAVESLLAEFGGIRAAGAPRPAAAAPVSSAPASTLETLLNAAGVSGHEAAIRETIQNLLPAWARQASRVDEKGNLIVRLGEKPERLFLSHMDELGFEVVDIQPEGSLLVETRGGGISDFFEWHPAVVHTSSGPLPALMLGPEGEAGGASLRSIVDVGAATAEQARAMGIKTGDTVTARKRLRPLLGGRTSSRSLDDRIGCAILIETLRSIRREDIKRPTWFAFTTAEETGLHGAEFLAQSVHPTEVYAIDTFVSSDSPLENQRFAAARLGGGFVIRAMDSAGITPRPAVARLADLARRHGIPVQYGVTSGANDGSQFVTGGALNIPIGWPIRYSHSPAEVADIADVEALGKIVRLLATH